MSALIEKVRQKQRQFAPAVAEPKRQFASSDFPDCDWRAYHWSAVEQDEHGAGNAPAESEIENDNGFEDLEILPLREKIFSASDAETYYGEKIPRGHHGNRGAKTARSKTAHRGRGAVSIRK